MMFVLGDVTKRIGSTFRVDNNAVTFSLNPIFDILEQPLFSIELNLKLRNQANIYVSGSSHCVHSQKS